MGLDGPLGSFAEAALSKVFEVDRAEVAYHEALGARVDQAIGAVCVANAALPHPAFNAAFSLDAEGQDPTDFVHRIERIFAREGVPFEFVATPLTRPADLGPAIVARGYEAISSRTWTELMVDPPSEPDDPRLRVFEADDIAIWAEVVAKGLEEPHAFDLLCRLGDLTRRAAGHRLFVATYMGEPAGGVEVSLDEGIAFVRRLAVKRRYRMRDVARALLHFGCEAAYADGGFRIIARALDGTEAERRLESFGFVGMQISWELARERPAFVLD